MRQNGVSGTALEWFKSFFINRTFQVEVRGSLSQPKCFNCGVPQGAINSPYYYSLYVSDLATALNNLNISYHFFADDLQLYISFDSVDNIQTILTALDGISDWMNSNHLKLNSDKTKFMLIGNRTLINNYFANLNSVTWKGQDISLVCEARNLGFVFDSNLTMEKQIKSLIKISNNLLRQINFIKKYLDCESLKRLICSLILSRIDYCNSLYINLPNTLLNKLQLIINRAARLISNIHPGERITPILIAFHWLPIKARILYKYCIIIYKTLKFEEPSYLLTHLERYTSSANVTIRAESDPYKLHIHRVNNKWGERSFHYNASRTYNWLPIDIKNSPTFELFKKRLKSFLFDKAYDLHSKTIDPSFATHV